MDIQPFGDLGDIHLLEIVGSEHNLLFLGQFILDYLKDSLYLDLRAEAWALIILQYWFFSLNTNSLLFDFLQ